MISHALFDAIAAQAKKKFPDSSYKDHLTKTLNEVNEALIEPKPKRLVEYADIFTCLIAAVNEDGFTADDLEAAAWYKLAVNRVRNWARQPDGTYQHLEEPQSP